MAHDVFISYSSKDKAVADAVCATLEQHHIRCWIAPRDIGPGAEWGESIVSAIHSSRVMVLIFSASANESPQIRREVERAVHKSAVIVPLRIEDVLPQKSLEYFLGAVHWLDAFGKPSEVHLQKLVGVVKGILGGPDAPLTERETVPGKKKGSRAVPLYVVGGFAVVLIVVLAILVFQRKREDFGQGAVTAGNGAAASPVVAGPGGAAASNSATRGESAPRSTAAVHLRSEKQTISVDEAKVMVVTHNFFREGWNAGGKGLTHQYETKAVQNVLVVVDHASGLMWQRGGSGERNGLQGDRKDADEYVRGLNAKKYAGFDDWRLPTLEEAMSLMTPPEKGQPGEVTDGDHTVKGVEHIDAAFENSAAPILWTADLQSPMRGWVIYFWDGICNLESLNFNAWVRAVRSLKSANE